jgi:hypothetical protein
MITGIGTPSNQSRIPRPIVSSSRFIEEKTRDAMAGSCVEKKPDEGTFYDFGISESDNPIRNSAQPSRSTASRIFFTHFGIDVA